MAQRPTKAKEQTTKAQGLTLKELEAQVGGLLPDRLEMRRRRRRGVSACNGVLACVPITVDIL